MVGVVCNHLIIPKWLKNGKQNYIKVKNQTWDSHYPSDVSFLQSSVLHRATLLHLRAFSPSFHQYYTQIYLIYDHQCYIQLFSPSSFLLFCYLHYQVFVDHYTTTFHLTLQAQFVCKLLFWLPFSQVSMSSWNSLLKHKLDHMTKWPKPFRPFLISSRKVSILYQGMLCLHHLQ